jgi:uncharacterized protein
LGAAHNPEGCSKQNSSTDSCRINNVVKHGVSFEQAASVMFDTLALTVLDVAHSTHEERWFTLGMSSNAQLLALSHTFVTTGVTTATLRLISARLATRQERRQYEEMAR